MQLTLKAPAKLNLCLKVVDRLPDGRHGLITLMQPLSLCDILSISDEADGMSLACDDDSLAGPDNLVLKAGRAWFKAAGLPPKAAFHLQKKIPVAAGLGGGSSDAAAALLGLNALYNGALAPERLLLLARGLGSDLAFFFGRGDGRVSGSGRSGGAPP